MNVVSILSSRTHPALEEPLAPAPTARGRYRTVLEISHTVLIRKGNGNENTVSSTNGVKCYRRKGRRRHP